MRKLTPRDPQRSELNRASKAALVRMAVGFGLPVCQDFTKADLVDILADRLTRNLEEQHQGPPPAP